MTTSSHSSQPHSAHHLARQLGFAVAGLLVGAAATLLVRRQQERRDYEDYLDGLAEQGAKYYARTIHHGTVDWVETYPDSSADVGVTGVATYDYTDNDGVPLAEEGHSDGEVTIVVHIPAEHVEFIQRLFNAGLEGEQVMLRALEPLYLVSEHDSFECHLTLDEESLVVSGELSDCYEMPAT